MSSRQTHAQTSIGQCMRRLHGKNAVFCHERFAPRLGGLEKSEYIVTIWHINSMISLEGLKSQTRDLLDIEKLGQEENQLFRSLCYFMWPARASGKAENVRLTKIPA